MNLHGAPREEGQVECKLTVQLPRAEGAAQLVLRERDQSVWIETVFVPAAARRQGAGTTLMQRALAYADGLGLPVDLLARPIAAHGPEATQRLVTFYQRFGFTVVNPSQSVPHMRRPPQVRCEAPVA
jgi:GNAT superfamily N-acetyltransferase